MATQGQQPNEEPIRLPLIITPENRDNITTTDSRLVNCYVERGRRKDEYHIYGRAGQLKFQQPSGGAAAGNGVYNWNGDIYSIFGSTLYKNGTNIGTVDATNGVYRFSQSLGSPTRLVLGNGVKAYTWDNTLLLQIGTSGATITAGAFVVHVTYQILTIGTTDFTLIGASANTVGLRFIATGVGAGTGTATASAFPTSFVKGWAFLDETTYAMTSLAVIQGSELNDPTYWDPLNALTAQMEPDKGVALNKQLAYVIALKQWSGEVFYDAAQATGSPLGTVQGAKVSFGCANADTVQEVDGILLWLCTNRSASNQVIMMDNLKAEIVSTKPVERLLRQIDTTQMYSFIFKDEGHKFYVLTSVVTNLTLVFDLSEREWCQWADFNGNYLPIAASTYNSTNRHIWQHATDGWLYYASRDYTNDSGNVITKDIYTPNYDGDIRNKKMLDKMTFVADQTSGSTLKVRHSDDDYKSWSNFDEVSLADDLPFLTDRGTFRKRAHNLRHQSNTTFRMQAIELNLRIGVL